jgi:hypothetical protein
MCSFTGKYGVAVGGTVSMVGLLAGGCDMIWKLVRVYLDQDGILAVYITLILFSSNSWQWHSISPLRSVLGDITSNSGH